MNPIDAAEAELQQELREMFTIDTQQHLEIYFSTIQQLNPRSWTADIQNLYRAIHTIKGGAVTVSADAMLQVAMVLEDLLSDLRYLEEAPILGDGELVQILLEAGELLSSSIEITETGDRAIEQVQPTVNRSIQLRDRVKQLYLPDWNELKQVHQEFAEQGFDLVILDLEMALARIPSLGLVPAQIIDAAKATLAQLTQIGVDIELAQGWTILLQDCQKLIAKPDCQLWRSVWFAYFQLLKACVKNSGEIAATDIERLAQLKSIVKSTVDSVSSNIAADRELLDSIDIFFLAEESEPASVSQFGEIDRASNALVDSLDNFFLDDAEASAVSNDFINILDDLFLDKVELISDLNLTPIPNTSISIEAFDKAATLTHPDSLQTESREINLDFTAPTLAISQDVKAEIQPIFTSNYISSDLSDTFDVLDEFSGDSGDKLRPDASELPPIVDAKIESIEDLPNLLDDFFNDISIESDEPDVDARSIASNAEPVPILESEVLPPIVADNTTVNPVAIKRIQIPVPLERLDKSAQQVVETLLTARAVTSISTQLQSQLHQLTTLTRENSQFVTRLRQLQDDYALLRNLSDEQQSGNNVTIERYRQGYTTIVRLLENILRLSELGQEIESSTYQSAIRLEALDRSILQLKDGIETSRLVPFRNLTLRAKAILRDLTNRYGKPAELIVENERIELDAGIVQQLEPALLHLLRNAYDHGLESTPQRLAAGKAAQGKIQISIQQRGNLYRLTIEDDGGGIDADQIHKIAKSQGFAIDQTRTNAELLAVLCQPGFSSSSTVTEVSGRGVGMDVVVTQINSIDGKLSLENYPGSGTKFTIDVPAPQLLIPCVLFQVGDRIVALPTDNVLETALLNSMTTEPTAANGRCTWMLTNLRGAIPGFDLNNYWQPSNLALGRASQRSFPDTAVCIRTRQASDTPEIWSIADDLIGQAKLLINPLPSPLIAPVGLLGVSLQPDGCLISVLDPIALTAMVTGTSIYANAVDVATPAASTPAKSSTPTILIVDDAAMIRRRLESSLNTYGFITHTCNDGLEALNWLQTNPLPDLMITDVEMPNMDGFTLIDRARQAQIEIPILVVSSRASAEWGKEARRLGASDYLNKGFATSELLQKVNSLLGLVVNV